MVVSKSRLMPSTADAELASIPSALDTLVSSNRSSAARNSACRRVSYILPARYPLPGGRAPR